MNDTLLRLSELLGARVEDAGGAHVGRVCELLASTAEAQPCVHALMVAPAGRRRAAPVRVPWAAVEDCGARRVRIRVSAAIPGSVADDELALGRDVLDLQIVDVAGRRTARVGDVELARAGGELRVVAVDVGWQAVARRLGLAWLARRGAPDPVDWTELHVARGRAHALQLASPAAAVQRLDAAGLAELVARLAPPEGRQLLREVGSERAAALLDAMAPEEAAAAVGDIDEQLRGALLARMDRGRAARLRALATRRHVRQGPADRPRRRYWHVLRGHAGWRR